MAIEFNCPHCGKLLTTSDQRRCSAKCPACDELITVPAASALPLPLSSRSGGVPSPAFAPTAAWSAPAPPESTTGFLTPGVSDAQGAATTRPGVAPDQIDIPSPNWRAVDRCPNCRAEFSKGSQFCSTCGASLLDGEPAFQYAPFWRRIVAISLDAAIIGAVAEAILYVVPGRIWLVENVGLIVWFFYHSALESSPEQATAGKWLMGIIVCGVDGRRISFLRAAIRTVARLLSMAICGVGYLMPLLTVRRQALHDVLTDTVVVRKCARRTERSSTERTR